MKSNMDNYDNYTPEIHISQKTVNVTDAPASEKVNRTSTKGKKTRQTKNEKPAAAQNAAGQVKQPWYKRWYAALTSPSARILFGIFLGCLCIYLTFAFVSYFSSCIKDQSQINTSAFGAAQHIANKAGEGGARLSEFLINECFGLGSFVIVIWLGAMSLKMLVGRPRFKSVNFTIKCLVALITVSLIVGLLTISMHSEVNWGGYHGRYVNEYIMHIGGGIGASLLCLFMIALFIVICLSDLVNWLIRLKRRRDERRRIAAEEERKRREKEEELRKMQAQEEIEDLKAGEAATISTNGEDIHDVHDPGQMEFGRESAVVSDTSIYSIDDTAENSDFDNRNQTYGDTSLSEYDYRDEPVRELEQSDASETSSDAPAAEGSESNEDAQDAPKKPMVVNVNRIDESGIEHYTVGNSPYDNRPYEFPPFDILREGSQNIEIDAAEQLENQEKIRSTLLEYRIPITDISATVGPTVTLYEIVPDKGVKIARISSLANDIALRIAAKGVRIIAPIPGKGTVGIEVPNKDPQTVSMRTIIRSRKFQESKYVLPIAIGSTISNDVYIADLAKMPHLLVAGATGQGKSVGLNAMIASLLYCKKPKELKFVMIDPKQVEFSLYNKIKDHYMAVIPGDDELANEPVITDMQKVEQTLNSLCIEMDDRYRLLKNAKCRNIEEYNAKYREGKLNPKEGHKFLPYIVVIVDEFGDLIMVLGKNVEMPIARLAQKARAVGMHVIIATQRPSTNVITGIIKANFPARISFKVSSGVDSKTILDTVGAQQLIGRGDMLIFNNSEMVRVQCAFIDTPEVEKICDYVSKQPYPTGLYYLPEPQVGGEGGEGVGDSASFGERDPLFEEVARLVVQTGQASTSSIQRRYRIGYNRAGSIMDQLEAVGVVGPAQGGKPRAVLMDNGALESVLGKE